MKARFLTPGKGTNKHRKGEGGREPWGILLELKMLVSILVFLQFKKLYSFSTELD